MDKEQLLAAIRQIGSEKDIDEEEVLSSLEDALGAAYRKEYGDPEEQISSEFDPETGKMKFFRVFDVVDDEEEVSNKKRELTKEEAKKIDEDAEVGEQVREELEKKDKFGRIAAQTAKQVILQQVREAERDNIYDKYKEKEGSVVNGVVQQIENRNVIVDLDNVTGIIFESEQVPDEDCRVGQRLKVYVKEVEKSNRGPVIKLSRTHPKLISYLFGQEVPEIESGVVEIKDIVREAGVRTKMSVDSNEEGVDPVGSCVGQRGTRVQSVLSEVGNEKIDIIPYSENIDNYIRNALSPAKVSEIKVDEENKAVKVSVDEDQLSLAIGKKGQNVRLASKLTGYEIDIVESENSKAEDESNSDETSDNEEDSKSEKEK
jgi:transcription termination/antitermination protein NusA